MYCNQTASLIWQLCQGDQTVSAIIDLRGAAFPEATERVRAEVMEALGRLFDAGCMA